MDVSARGLTFEVVVSGPPSTDAQPPVLLLHGFPQNRAMWDRVEAFLHPMGQTTIVMDQRGYSPGARPADVSAYAIGECVSDVIAVLDQLDLPKVHLVGHDWGAVVAWHVTAEHPDRVATLTALAVPHPTAFGEAIATDDDQRQRSAYFQLFRQEGKAESVLLRDNGEPIRAMFAGCPPERVETYVAPMLEPGALTAALNWYRAMGRSMACPEVRVPTTYVWGERDIAVGRTAARACAAHVVGPFQFETLDASHWMADEMPEQVSEIILERIKGADAA
jgi:pimeloyl-ACP methyl ester carboxylesterase